jgi:hypothetical protein
MGDTMGDLRNVTDFVFNEATVDASEELESEWRGAEDLNGSQFYVSYSAVGSPTVDLEVDISAVGQVDARKRDYEDWMETVEVESGAAEAGHFVAAPTEMNSPFGAYRVRLTTDGALTNVRVALCRHGLG